LERLYCDMKPDFGYFFNAVSVAAVGFLYIFVGLFAVLVCQWLFCLRLRSDIVILCLVVMV
ncbi:RusA family crossover junction endodeoxyribonuclease, partial [Enterococcus faecalis]